MISAILLVSESVNQHSFIYKKLAGMHVLERTVLSLSRSDQLQSIVVLAPRSQQYNIQGAGIQTATLDMSIIDKSKVTLRFYNGVSKIEAVHEIASQIHADHVLICDADQVLLPAWLVDGAIVKYFSDGAQRPLKPSGYDKIFDFTVLPFWMLADIKRTQKGIEEYVSDAFFKSFNLFQNDGEYALKTFISKFDYNNPFLEYMLAEIDVGADLDDLILDFNERSADDKQENVKE